MPIFVHDDGRVLGPTARHLWDRLLEESELKVGQPAGPTAEDVFTAVKKAAESHGRATYEDLIRQHRDSIERERRKGDFAFQSRRRSVNRIGLPAVRARRMAELEAEERTWRKELERRSHIEPEMVPIIVVRVLGGAE
jgi:hypothetical protein